MTVAGVEVNLLLCVYYNTPQADMSRIAPYRASGGCESRTGRADGQWPRRDLDTPSILLKTNECRSFLSNGFGPWRVSEGRPRRATLVCAVNFVVLRIDADTLQLLYTLMPAAHPAAPRPTPAVRARRRKNRLPA